MKDAVLNQEAAAALMKVDRTTIRAWTSAGMPFTERSGPGHEAQYSVPVLILWRTWSYMKKRGQQPDVSPLVALALAKLTLLADESIAPAELCKDLVAALRGHFDPMVIAEAFGYARGLQAAASKPGRKG